MGKFSGVYISMIYRLIDMCWVNTLIAIHYFKPFPVVLLWYLDIIKNYAEYD